MFGKTNLCDFWKHHAEKRFGQLQLDAQPSRFSFTLSFEQKWQMLLNDPKENHHLGGPPKRKASTTPAMHFCLLLQRLLLVPLFGEALRICSSVQPSPGWQLAQIPGRLMPSDQKEGTSGSRGSFQPFPGIRIFSGNHQKPSGNSDRCLKGRDG